MFSNSRGKIFGPWKKIKDSAKTTIKPSFVWILSSWGYSYCDRYPIKTTLWYNETSRKFPFTEFRRYFRVWLNIRVGIVYLRSKLDQSEANLNPFTKKQNVTSVKPLCCECKHSWLTRADFNLNSCSPYLPQRPLSSPCRTHTRTWGRPPTIWRRTLSSRRRDGRPSSSPAGTDTAPTPTSSRPPPLQKHTNSQDVK